MAEIKLSFVVWQLHKANTHLEFTDLRVKGEGVEEHGADECDVGGLAVVHPLPGVYPQPSKLGQNINSFKCFQVVDEDVGNPEAFNQLQVYWKE